LQSERPLHLDRGRHAGLWRRERRKKGVTLRAFFVSPVDVEGRANYSVVITQYARVRVVANSAQERSGALDVGEEEGQRLDEGMLRDLL
jgi:hypothetical protein